MPSVSDRQRRFFGMVLAAKRGQLKNPSQEVSKTAGSISEQSASDFASSVEKKKKREGVSRSLMRK